MKIFKKSFLLFLVIFTFFGCKQSPEADPSNGVPSSLPGVFSELESTAVSYEPLPSGFVSSSSVPESSAASLAVSSDNAEKLPEWAVVTVPVCPLYNKPDTASVLDTQALFNQRVRVHLKTGEFLKVTVPDGYTGYIEEKNITYSLSSLDGNQFCYVAVTLSEITGNDQKIKFKVPMCTELSVKSETETSLAVLLPGETVGYIQKSDTKMMPENGKIKFTSGQAIVDTARLFSASYLWGGTSVINGIDCSGLTYICYRQNGITLPRDAEPQSQKGAKISLENAAPGDLVFFSKNTDKKGISHVGIYIGGGKFIHSSTDNKGMGINALDETYFKSRLVSINRYYSDS